MDRDKVIVISGHRGSGKTTLCAWVTEMARVQGLVLGGVLTRARFDEGCKVALEVEDVRSGARCTLATQEESADGPSTGAWHFRAAGLSFGAQALAHATPCDVLIIDELGPLELERGEGWRSGLGLLAAGRYRLALVVVRPELLDEFQRQLGAEPVVLTAKPEECEALAARILSELGELP